YHPADARGRLRPPADSALDPPRAARAPRCARPARTDPERPLPEAGLRLDGEGAHPEADAREGVEGGDRAPEPGARQRDAEARAAPEAPARPAARAEGDVAAHARGARRPDRDAGAAGRGGAGGDQPPDAAAAREAEEAEALAPQRK